MRVVLVGGTRFIGRRITESLVERGDEVLVVHRGHGEPVNWVSCAHLHVDRSAFAEVAERVRAFRPDAVVDTLAMSRADADAVLPHLPDVPIVVLSSMDVYRAFELALAGQGGIPVPLDEESPVRRSRNPHRGTDPGLDGYEIDMNSYDKLDVEPLYLDRGATVLRLAMVYGPHDPQRREEFVLRRVRADRRRIPVGTGNFLWTRVHVDDVASAVLAALDRDAARGTVFNIGETATGTQRDWIEHILDVAGHHAELVPVADELVPEDLALTRAIPQHMLVSSARARSVLDWRPADPADRVAESVRWHLAHPPEPNGTEDFSADDRALER